MELHTNRLLLRPFRESDLDPLADWQSRPDVARFLYWEPRSREEAEAALPRRLGETELERDDDVLALAVERRADGLLLGDAGSWLRSVERRQVEIGYAFHPDAGGRGYATEAARALIDFAFEILNAHRVFARRPTPDRRPSSAASACARRLTSEAEIFKGAWGDELVFAILDREWPSTLPHALRAPPSPPPRYDPFPAGAVAQLAKAPVSKTGDSRFESWLPRSREPSRRAKNAARNRRLKRSGFDFGLSLRNRSGMRCNNRRSTSLSPGLSLESRNRRSSLRFQTPELTVKAQPSASVPTVSRR